MKRAPSAALVAAVLITFSPALDAWSRRLIEEPGVRYVLAVPVLWFVAAGRIEMREPRDHSLGALLLALGAAIQAAFLLAGFSKGTVVALPLAVAGVLTLTRGSLQRSNALAAFLVPLPSALASPFGLHHVWAELAVRCWRRPAPFELSIWDSGAPLAMHLSAVALAWSWRSGRDACGGAWRAPAAALLAFPAEAVIVVVSVGVAIAGLSGPARSLLTYGPWIASTACTLWLSRHSSSTALAR